MNAIYYGTACWIGNCTGSGPWVGGDLENVSSLRAHANHEVATAENACTSPLIANRTQIRTWEEFGLTYD
jgi:hypothetical protein